MMNAIMKWLTASISNKDAANLFIGLVALLVPLTFLIFCAIVDLNEDAAAVKACGVYRVISKNTIKDGVFHHGVSKVVCATDDPDVARIVTVNF